MARETIALELSKQEAIVFMAFLLRFRDRGELSVEVEGEQEILWDLCCLLEDKLPELLAPNWNEVLAEARKVIGAHDHE